MAARAELQITLDAISDENYACVQKDEIIGVNWTLTETDLVKLNFFTLNQFIFIFYNMQQVTRKSRGSK